MYPHERSLVKKMEGKPFALIGVNSDKDRDALKQVLKKEEITWRSFWNGKEGTGGPISTKWNVQGWPTLYILDHKGIIRHKWPGSPSGDVLDEAIDKLVEEAEGGKKKQSKGDHAAPTPALANTLSPDADIDKHALAATADDEASLDQLAQYLARPCKSDRDKARAIYRWITDRI